MIKSALAFLVGMKPNVIHRIGDRDYSEQDLHLIKEDIDRPRAIGVNSLDSLVALVKSELARTTTSPFVDGNDLTLFVRVNNFNSVEVFTSLMDDMTRHSLYKAESEIPIMKFGNFMDYESAMITLRSKFIPSDDVDYLVNLLSKITDENSVASEDNGLSQSVTVKKGISMASQERIKARVKLTPFRTFLEAEQPESEFIVRLREGGEIALFEADGGMWELDAKQNIFNYLYEQLKDLFDGDNKVILMK